jgi:cell division septation protein DedD
MGKYDRGVYEPSDEVRAFDGAEDEDDVEGSRLPLLIVLALLVLAMFAGVVWLASTQGVARGRGDTPVLTAAAGPERVAPPAAASGTVPYQGFKIYEQPAPPDDEVGDAPAPSKPAPTAAAPAAPKPAPVTAPAPPKATATASPPPATKPAAVPAPAPPKSVASLIQQSNSVPAPAAAKPAPMPAKPAAAPPKPASAPSAARPAASAPPSVATGAPRQLGMAAAPPPAAAPKVAAAPLPPVAAKPAGGGFVLQIGSYKSQADAEAAWRTYKGRHAALLSGYSENIQQADLGDRGTWYRLRIGGLADREVAGALCERLKADGGACILGR